MSYVPLGSERVDGPSPTTSRRFDASPGLAIWQDAQGVPDSTSERGPENPLTGNTIETDSRKEIQDGGSRQNLTPPSTWEGIGGWRDEYSSSPYTLPGSPGQGSDVKGFRTRLREEKADSKDYYARSPLSAKDDVHLISTPTQTPETALNWRWTIGYRIPALIGLSFMAGKDKRRPARIVTDSIPVKL